MITEKAETVSRLQGELQSLWRKLATMPKVKTLEPACFTLEGGSQLYGIRLVQELTYTSSMRIVASGEAEAGETYIAEQYVMLTWGVPDPLRKVHFRDRTLHPNFVLTEGERRFYLATWELATVRGVYQPSMTYGVYCDVLSFFESSNKLHDEHTKVVSFSLSLVPIEEYQVEPFNGS